MFEIKMTINGKPATESNINNEIGSAIFHATVESIREAISGAITAAEAQQITVDMVGKDIKNLSVNVKGPEEIVSKIKAAL